MPQPESRISIWAISLPSRATRAVDTWTRPPAVSVADGVAHDVEDDLAKGVFVAQDGGRVVCGGKGKFETRLLGDGLHELDTALHARGGTLSS